MVHADTILAFNAAVVLIGAVWVYRDTSLCSASMTAQTKKVQQYPARAVMALSKLDDGNRLIDRCRYYLEQFNKILVDPGKSFFVYHSSCFFVELLMSCIETDLEGLMPTLPALASTRGSNLAADFSLLPFGMELGEFMMDDDLVAMIDKQGILAQDPGLAYPV